MALKPRSQGNVKPRSQPPMAQPTNGPRLKFRSIKSTPSIPGGFLANPPAHCESFRTYCPDPIRFEEVRIVDYSVCCYSCQPRMSKYCPVKDAADCGKRDRIRRSSDG